MRPARSWTRIAAAAGAGLLAAVSIPFAVPGPAAGRTVADGDCGAYSTKEAPTKLWAQQRVGLTPPNPLADLATGAGVRVAVIDSGLNHAALALPQMQGIRVDRPTNLVNGGGDVTDCVGHGTAVTGIIAAQPSNQNGYVGVAPDATIIPIKFTNTDASSGSGSGNGQNNGGTTADMVAAINQAVNDRARVINISATVDYPRADLANAIARARAANVVIVAASGNDTDDAQHKCGPCYPAAYSTSFDNVIAVASTGVNDRIASTSVGGQVHNKNVVNISAPGDGAEVVNKYGTSETGFLPVSGTSYAAPFVTGTVALLLQKFSKLTPAQVRTRLEATADPPPGSVPDETYGYGIVDPRLALTAVGTIGTSTGADAAGRQLPAPVAPTPPDRHLQHLALGIGLSLLALAIIAAVAAGVVRSDRRRGSALS